MDPSLFNKLEAEREEITKVKNIPRIQLGRWEIDAWYYSPFPERCRGKKLYICEYTLKVRAGKFYGNARRARCARHNSSRLTPSATHPTVHDQAFDVGQASRRVHGPIPAWKANFVRRKTGLTSFVSRPGPSGFFW